MPRLESIPAQVGAGLRNRETGLRAGGSNRAAPDRENSHGVWLSKSMPTGPRCLPPRALVYPRSV